MAIVSRPVERYAGRLLNSVQNTITHPASKTSPLRVHAVRDRGQGVASLFTPSPSLHR